MRFLLAPLAAVLVLSLAAPAGAAHQAAKTRTVAVSLTAETKADVPAPAPGKIQDRGTITGKPIGRGTLVLLATFDRPSHVSATYTITTSKGRITGTADLTYTIVGQDITFTGTAKVTGGTKAYKGAKGSGLKVVDTNKLDGQSGHVVMTGKVRIPR